MLPHKNKPHHIQPINGFAMRFSEICGRGDVIRTNPAIGCKLPPKKSREMKVLTQNEVIRFLNRAKEEGYYELFILELGTGMRRGEILALKWSDLNFTTGELHIERQVNVFNKKQIISAPKTKSSIRTVILPPSLLQILSEYKETINSESMSLT